MDVADLVHPGTLAHESAVTKSRRPVLSMAWLKWFLREPLVHFLALGILIFLVFKWTGNNAGPSSHQIVITHGQIEDLAVGFARSWQRPASEAELKGLVDEYVKDEIAVREATAMGLDRDDTIIRRRLRQKLEFITEDTVASSKPTDAELQSFMDRHPDSFRTDPQFAFRQVYVNTTRRGASALADAEKLLAQLRAEGAKTSIDRLGDPTMLPAEQSLAPQREIGRAFGDDFAQQLTQLEPGKWSGPVESSFGLHLVLIEEKMAAARPALADVKPLVEREYQNERRKADLQALYDRLLKKYYVTVEKSQSPLATAAVSNGIPNK